VLVSLAGVGGASAGATLRPHQHIAASVTWPSPNWEVSTQGAITQSSPTVATVDGKTIVAVGDESGYVYVLNAATGKELPGWPEHVAAGPGQSAPIESSPTIAWLDGPAKPPSIIVGTGSTWVSDNVGEVEAFRLDGAKRFVFRVQAAPGTNVGVLSSPAVGSLTGHGPVDIVFGSWDHNIWALTPAGRVLPGFPYNNADTIWSSPALYRLPGQRGDAIFIGSDASGVTYRVAGAMQHCVGGFVGEYRYITDRVVPIWRDCEPQSVWSSPAVGILNNPHRPVVVIGTSFYEQPFPAETNHLLAFDALTGKPLPGWPVATAGPVLGSPAIGDVAPGVRAVVDTSWVCDGSSRTDCFAHGSKVYAWTGHGAQLWSDALPGPTDWASPVLVPLENHAANDVLVGTPNALYPLDGATGAFLYGTNGANQFAGINPGCRVFNSAAVADIPGSGPGSGWRVVEACGGPPVFQPHGTIVSYRLPVTPSITPAWPMFRNDAQHNGGVIPPALALEPPAALTSTSSSSS